MLNGHISFGICHHSVSLSVYLDAEQTQCFAFPGSPKTPFSLCWKSCMPYKELLLIWSAVLCPSQRSSCTIRLCWVALLRVGLPACYRHLKALSQVHIPRCTWRCLQQLQQLQQLQRAWVVMGPRPLHPLPFRALYECRPSCENRRQLSSHLTQFEHCTAYFLWEGHSISHFQVPLEHCIWELR